MFTFNRMVGLGFVIALIGIDGCATGPRPCPVSIGERLDITVPVGWTLDDHVYALLQAAGRGNGPEQNAFTLEALRLATDPFAAPLIRPETNIQALAVFHGYVTHLRTLQGKGVCESETRYVNGLYRDFLKLVPPRSAAWPHP